MKIFLIYLKNFVINHQKFNTLFRYSLEKVEN